MLCECIHNIKLCPEIVALQKVLKLLSAIVYQVLNIIATEYVQNFSTVEVDAIEKRDCSSNMHHL